MAKKLLSLSVFSVFAAFLCLNAAATTHIVQVANSQFTPSSGLNVNVGDTVQFTWVSGNHTTTSVNVPVGAATWNSPMTSLVTVFNYKVTVEGTYNYKCTPHNFVGSFTASTLTGIQDITEVDIATSIFPNPFANELFINKGNEEPEYTQISISDILGKQIKNMDIQMLSETSGRKRIDVAELPKGIYFVTLKGSGIKARTMRLIKE